MSTVGSSSDDESEGTAGYQPPARMRRSPATCNTRGRGLRGAGRGGGPGRGAVQPGEVLSEDLDSSSEDDNEDLPANVDWHWLDSGNPGNG